LSAKCHKRTNGGNSEIGPGARSGPRLLKCGSRLDISFSLRTLPPKITNKILGKKEEGKLRPPATPCMAVRLSDLSHAGSQRVVIDAIVSVGTRRHEVTHHLQHILSQDAFVCFGRSDVFEMIKRQSEHRSPIQRTSSLSLRSDPRPIVPNGRPQYRQKGWRWRSIAPNRRTESGSVGLLSIASDRFTERCMES
jgi:hypothetical protein